MTELAIDPKYITKAVTDLGARHAVVTTQAIFNDRGIKIIEKNVQINADLYERLMAHALTQPIEDSVTSTAIVTGSMLRARAEQSLRELPFFARLGADGTTHNVLLDTLEKLTLPAPLAFQLMIACEVQPALFHRSVDMALFAAWLTLGPLVTRFDISLAASAGLLHDLGMLHLDPVLLTPRQDIDRDQRRQLYAHPLVCTALIERHHQYPRELLRAIKEHHEFIDGSGYPSNLSGPAISPLGRILSIGELVTTMLAPQSEACEFRLSVLLRMNRHRYDAALLERVLQHLQPHTNLPANDAVAAMHADPVSRLMEIDAVLSDWPADPVLKESLKGPRREGMAAVAEQAAQLHRTLASVGVAPQQLAQVGSVAQDSFLQSELLLLAQEATWQLRTLARQARRRWQLEPGGQYPDALGAWLQRVDALTSSLQSHAPTPSDDAA